MRIAQMFFLSLALLVLSFSFAPQAHALNIWEGALCGGTPITTGGPTGPCTLCDAFVVGMNIINFLTQIAIPITVGVTVWGGIKMMIAGGDPGKIQDSKKVIWSGFKGLLIVMCAWMLVNIFFSVIAQGISGGGTWRWFDRPQCQ
jgi:hypothetical protein